MRYILAVLILLLAPLAVAQAPSQQELLDRVAANPADGAARLALAELDYTARRDQSAEFNARQALASDLTREQAARARDILAGLQRRRTWISNADFAFAPETTRTVLRDLDPNNGRSDDVITETQSSGVGVVGFGSIEHRARLGEDVRWSSEAVLKGELFGDSDFNDLTLTLLTGPLFLGASDDRTGVRALAQQRWFGGEVDFTAYGAQVFTQRALSDRVRAFGRFTMRDVDYDHFNGRDGQTYGLDGSISRFGLSGRFEQVFGLVFRNQAEASNQSFWFGRVGAGAFREVGFGLGVLVQPTLAWQGFDGVDPVGGKAREDVTTALTVRTVKRDWRLWGSSPYLSVRAERRNSNIDLFDEDDVTLQAGFTRTF